MAYLNNTIFKTDHYSKYWFILLNKLTICENSNDKNKFIQKLKNSTKPRVLSFLNVHSVNLNCSNKKFRKGIGSSDYLLRDGSGINIMMKLLGYLPGINLNGTDLIPEILNAWDKDIIISVYGTKGKFLKSGVEEIQKLGFKTVFSEDGFHSNKYYLEKSFQQKPDLIILAMGMPKQEILSLELKNISNLNQAVLIINGGGVIDFMSKRIKRAPMCMRKAGFEWLYRLANDPKRLWKRNVGSFVFILRTLKLKFLDTI